MWCSDISFSVEILDYDMLRISNGTVVATSSRASTTVGQTPLNLATGKGHVEICSILVADVVVNVTGQNGCSVRWPAPANYKNYGLLMFTVW